MKYLSSGQKVRKGGKLIGFDSEYFIFDDVERKHYVPKNFWTGDYY